MDLVARLIVLVCVFWAGSAHAGAQWYAGIGTASYPDIGAARTYVCSWSSPAVVDTCTLTDLGTVGVVVVGRIIRIDSTAHNPGGAIGSRTWSTTYLVTCDAAGEVANSDGACGPPDNECPLAGTVEGDSGNAYQASSINPTICIGEGTKGCVWKPGGTVPAVCANGKCYQWGPFTATGASCNPSTTVPGGPQAGASAPAGDVTCVSKGQCPGTVNGTNVCVACGSKSTTSSSSSSASGPGAGSAPGSGSGSSGSTSGTGGISGTPLKCVGPDCAVTTTKTSETTCVGAECTTKTTTKTTATSPSGGVSGGQSGSTTDDSSSKTESETKDKDSFCAENPKSVLCKDALDSKWGGVCSGGFTCDGDAVQCAQAQAANKSYCESHVEQTDATVQLGIGSMNGQAHPGNHPYLDPTAIDFASGAAGVLSPINPFGGSCPDDITIQVIGTSVVIPLSDACPILRIMGLVAVAFTTFACAFIQLGALKAL